MPKKKTTEQFISEANLVHEDKYDYSKTICAGVSNKVVIICPEHGEFEQTPHGHLSGKGCTPCGRIRTTVLQRSSLDKILEKFKEVHGDFYNYSQVIYEGNHTKVKIICPKHGKFEQTPGHHINDQNGCPNCGEEKVKLEHIKRTRTLQEFINEANLVHEDRYDYSKTIYTGANNKVIIICLEHGEFEQNAQFHLSGCGCPDCGRISGGLLRRNSHQSIITKFREIHGDRYIYDEVEYKGTSINVIIICLEHGSFEQLPLNHIKGHGCHKCASTKRGFLSCNSQKSIITRFIQTHENKYTYDNVVYENLDTKVDINCQKHGIFKQTPASHIRGAGCPECSKEHYQNEAECIVIMMNLK